MDAGKDRKRIRFPAAGAALAVPLILAASLTGCTQGPHYQDSLIAAAKEGPAALSLPRGEGLGAPVPLWDSVLIVCPYSDTQLVPEPFADEARTLDVTTTDSVQWLLFSGHNGVSPLSIERTTVDFCHAGAPPAQYDHDQLWSAQKSDGAWVMTPARP